MSAAADRPVAPPLTDAELSEIAPFGDEREVRAGELLFEAGEATNDLLVVLEGELQVLRGSSGEEILVMSFGPGSFVGELTLLTGQRRFLSCRASRRAGCWSSPRSSSAGS